jgi:hypothetical protein
VTPVLERREAGFASGGEREVTVTLRPERVVRVLLVVIAALLVVGAIATSLMYLVASDPETSRLSRLSARFSLSLEPNFLNYYSSLAFVASAAGLVLVYLHERASGGRDARAWAWLAVLLGLLGADEYVMLHEMANRTIHEAFHTTGIFTFAWVIPATIFAVLVFVFFLGFLRRLDRRTSRFFVLGGALVVIGAAGLEMAAGLITERWGFYSVAHIAEQFVEEGIEMLGGLVFLYGVLDHLRRHVGIVRLELGTAEKEA